jgi:phosphoribosylanthranilate isomerase
MTRVKICGIRSLAEARWAVNAEAWAIGFVFAPSSRRITVEEAARIIKELPAGINKVGVFVDMNLSRVKDIVKSTGINMLQFHGSESPEYCSEWHLPVIKSFTVRDEDSLLKVKYYQVYAHLFDTYQPGSAGGTGKTFNWQLLHNIKPEQRTILAGGLNPSNVIEAIRLVKPFAVDVSSGVETGGTKNRKLIEQFVSRVSEVI